MDRSTCRLPCIWLPIEIPRNRSESFEYAIDTRVLYSFHRLWCVTWPENSSWRPPCEKKSIFESNFNSFWYVHQDPWCVTKAIYVQFVTHRDALFEHPVERVQYFGIGISLVSPAPSREKKGNPKTLGKIWHQELVLDAVDIYYRCTIIKL